ncbi:HlyC/CorC family transporter [Nitrococcus mobilis]|uniref:Magnesium and cobalt efflux protein CorC n=1 Tax=Nitrococcus mobilis Nb-231 TaxID=314278 RepID=A4BQ72_9GAMM|nr:transporter associated domain-containing protein [Nitrococcus mobilis]EAR22227.1 Putative Mg2+ and Co2+ transporter CorC [Nitrococcus mobilis Nb-231]
MNEDQSDSINHTDSSHKSWLERLGQALAGAPKDREELTELLRLSRERGILDQNRLSMIEGVLRVSELQARDIMVARSQVAMLQRSCRIWDLLPTITETGHSRFPVTGESRDDVIGILIAKDLLPYLAREGEPEFNLRELLRPALFIPESKRLDALLKLFQESRNHMAIVVDEYGGLAGIVTIEDVIEQIVGDIDDEHDLNDESYILNHQEDGRTVVKALAPIAEFNEHFNTDFSDEEFDTIGGLVANRFGHVPRRGESTDIGQLHFEVVSADSRRIQLLAVRPLEATENTRQAH